MIMTVTARSSEKSNGLPMRSHVTSVAEPTVIAITVSQSAARLAKSCVLDFDSCAARTISMT